MRLVITCGPSYEPIDQARRLTNFSTGRLGAVLSDFLAARGHDVTCLRGEGATAPPPAAARVIPFGTNDDLAARLQALPARDGVEAVLHAAALCDFRVEQVLDGAGQPVASAKFSTRSGRLQLVLAPALKVLPHLREWFPNARIVGWKYEPGGTREEALGAARRQVEEAGVHACVVNGAGFGPGFGLWLPSGALELAPDAAALAELLDRWLGR